MTAQQKYHQATEREFGDFCDKYFSNDSEIEKGCLDKHIPIE